MKHKSLIIGLTGRFGAGCTTTSMILKDCKGFNYFSLSESLKKKAKMTINGFDKKEEKEKRKILQDLGDELRKNGESLAIPVIEEIKQKGLNKVVIDSIRNPAEVNAFKNKFNNFFLLAIDAETETRWQRLNKYIYKGNKDKFCIDDERDAGENQPDYGQQVKKCIELADMLVNNNDDFYNKPKGETEKIIDEYAQKISDYVDLIFYHGIRPPSTNELCMHYACSIALKSTCLRRQVGAVIVHEKHYNFNKSKHITDIESYVIATGCNNVPIGETHCRETEEGCYKDHAKLEYLENYNYCRQCGSKLDKNLICEKCDFDNSKLPGKLLDICRAVHAEEAAILQAAKLGSTSLEGTKIYTSTFPCMLCCKTIINSGIKGVVYLESYPMSESLALEMFRKCNIKVSKYEGVNSIAFNRLFKK